MGGDEELSKCSVTFNISTGCTASVHCAWREPWEVVTEVEHTGGAPHDVVGHEWEPNCTMTGGQM